MENEPKVRLNIGGVEHELTPDNASLFMFIGKTVINGVEHDNTEFNHVFYQTGAEDDNRMKGIYLFKGILPEIFNELAEYMGQTGYPAHINLRTVAECDRNAYMFQLAQYTERDLAEIPDFLPDEF